jgi:regulatory protein
LAASADADALALLARRELSEAQIRRHLARRGHDARAIDGAVERLKADRSLDDERVAGAIARTELRLRPRGRIRVRQRIEAAGIDPAIAARAVDAAFADVDADALLEAALARRLRGLETPLTDADLGRLYRALTAQGFEPDRVLALLRRRGAGAQDR